MSSSLVHGLHSLYKPSQAPKAHIVNILDPNDSAGEPSSLIMPAPLSWSQCLHPAESKFRDWQMWGLEYEICSSLKGDLPAIANGLLSCMEEAIAPSSSSGEETIAPIVFVAKSIGGLIVKLAYVAALSPRRKAILQRVRAIVFMGTPHKGTVSTRLFQQPSDEFVDLLRLTILEFTFVQNLDVNFRSSLPDIQIFSLYETLETDLGSWNGILVSKQDATLGCPGEIMLPVSSNHRNLGKFTEADNNICMTLVGTLQSIIDKSQATRLPRHNTIFLEATLFSGVTRKDKGWAIPYETSRRQAISPKRFRKGEDWVIESPSELPYTHMKVLGRGGYGDVDMVKDDTTGSVFARKILKKRFREDSESVRFQYLNEIAIMRKLSTHHHAIEIFATYSFQTELAFILRPVADRGSLKEFLDANKEGPCDEARQILHKCFGCLSNALAFIHQEKIRHKDINPKNILVHKGSFIITDFGIALDCSFRDSTTTTGPPGGVTFRYSAPEVFSGPRNRKSDVFSLGCVFADVISVLQPDLIPADMQRRCYFEVAGGLCDLLRSVVGNQDNTLDLRIPCQATRQMLDADSSQRPSARQITLLLGQDQSLFCDLCLEEETELFARLNCEYLEKVK